MNALIFYSLLLIISFLISVLVVPVIIRISHSINIYDAPNFRKVHSTLTSRLGGFGIFLSFFITLLIFDRYLTFSFNFHIYLLALVIIFAMGFYDDINNLRAKYKLLIQVLVGIIIGFSGLRFEELNFLGLFTIRFGIFSFIITSLWVVSFINAINLIDGIDGLASGVVIIASAFFFVIALIQDIPSAALFSIILIGSALGFYVYNFPPARIFMGDGGAYLLGFVCATIPLMGIKKASVVNIFLVPFILLLIPLYDTINVIFSRLRHKKHIFTADKSHIHHRLKSLGFSTVQILIILYTANILLGLLSVLMVQIHPILGVYILIVVFLGLSLGFYMIYTIERNLKNNASKAKDTPVVGKITKIRR